MADKKRAAFWIGAFAAAVTVGYHAPPYLEGARVLADPEIQDALTRLPQIVELVDGSLADLLDATASLRADVEAMRRPAEVVQFSTASYAVGDCVVGEPCEFQVRARRTPEGLDCQIVPDRTRHQFVSHIDRETRFAARIPSGPPVNIGLDWTWLTIKVWTPRMPSGDADYVVISVYSSCPHTQGGDLIQAPSDPIPVRIINRSE